MLMGLKTPHLAVAWPLADGEHRGVVHRPRAAIDEAVRTALRALLPVELVTLLWTIALLGMTVYLLTTRHQEVLEHERARATSHVLRQTQEIIRTRDAVIFALAKLAGSRDHETGGHLERISAYSTLIATALRDHPGYTPQVTPTFVRLIEISAVLHDIGKVGVEDCVLRKPGRLTPAEREHMQRHTVIAGQCLGEIAQRLGSSNFLEMARDIARDHHERWDGAGYPSRLKREQIPLAARIVAIADVYDALVTPRVYKRALSHEDSIAIIAAGAGTQFDPELVAVALTLQRGLREILHRHTQPGAGDTDSRFVAERGSAERQPGVAAPADTPATARETAPPSPEAAAVASPADAVTPTPP